MINFIEKFDPERIGIARHAQRNPDGPALIMDDIVITFSELDSHTNALANALIQLGAGPGDRISILFHNSPEILKAWSAAGKISVTPIALNYRFKEDELAYQKKRLKLALETQKTDERMQKQQLEAQRITTDRLEQNLVTARKNLDELNIRAPISGKLSGFDAEVGQNFSMVLMATPVRASRL